MGTSPSEDNPVVKLSRGSSGIYMSKGKENVLLWPVLYSMSGLNSPRQGGAGQRRKEAKGHTEVILCGSPMELLPSCTVWEQWYE